MDAYLLHVGKYQENTVKSNICAHCWFFIQIRFRDFTLNMHCWSDVLFASVS